MYKCAYIYIYVCSCCKCMWRSIETIYTWNTCLEQTKDFSLKQNMFKKKKILSLHHERGLLGAHLGLKSKVEPPKTVNNWEGSMPPITHNRDIPLNTGWLIGILIYIYILAYSLYNWVVFHPFYNPTKTGKKKWSRLRWKETSREPPWKVWPLQFRKATPKKQTHSMGERETHSLTADGSINPSWDWWETCCLQPKN